MSSWSAREAFQLRYTSDPRELGLGCGGFREQGVGFGGFRLWGLENSGCGVSRICIGFRVQGVRDSRFGFRGCFQD